MIAKRLSFRPRPLDIYKKLPLVTTRDESDGGVVGARGASSNAATFKLDGQQVDTALASSAKKAVNVSDIPTPQFLVVESYEANYTSTFVQSQSYIRARPARSENLQYCEYDLDDDDEHWLNVLNAERSILPAEKFELMLYKLELVDYQKGLMRDKDRPGPQGPVFGIPTPIALNQKDANEVLKGLSSVAVIEAVYDYWRGKRECTRKPILRRLQPAPPVNDSSPFNVFRPREKAPRTNTRRMQSRRENDEKSYAKLRKIRNQLEEIKEVMRLLKKREKMKRELMQVESNIQRLEMSLKVGQFAQQDALPMVIENGVPTPSRVSGVEDGYHLQLRINHLKGNERPITTSELTPPGNHATAVGEAREPVRIPRRRSRFPSTRSRFKGEQTKASETLDPSFLFTQPLDLGKLESAGIELDAVDDNRPIRLPGRIGRGGRLVFDRRNTVNQLPVGALDRHFAPKPFATLVEKDRPTWSSSDLPSRWQLQRA